MIPSDYPLPLLLATAFLFGTVFGSFLNVCVHRFPLHERFVDQLRSLWGRSACPQCRQEILARDNIPIVGWILLRGKCRNCRLRISPRYPLIELLNGLLFMFVYWMELPRGLETTLTESCVFAANGPQIVASGYSEIVWLHARYLFHLALIESLLVATLIDLDHRIIPDGSTLPAMLFALIASTVFGQTFLVPVWFEEPSFRETFQSILPAWLQPILFEFDGPQFAAAHPHWHGLAVSLAGLVIGGGVVWGVRIIGFRVLRQEAMGFGDVILMAAIGAFIGWQPVIVVFFIAPLVAIVTVVLSLVVHRSREIPYGPYLSLGTLIVLMAWPTVWPPAERMFEMGPMVFLIGGMMFVSLFACLMMMQLAKRLLGIPLYPPPEQDWVEEWTSADQLLHFAGERVDEQQGQWRRETWPGCHSGRGRTHDDVWRQG